MTKAALRVLFTAVSLVALVATRARAWDSGAAFDLLRPGSHGAVGMGGDPFLSPLEDQVGWWSDLNLHTASGSRVELDTSQPLRAGGGTGFESRDLSVQTNVDGRLSRILWNAGIELDRPSWSLGWEGSQGSLSGQGSSGGVDAGIRLGILRSVTWQLRGAASTSPSTVARAGFGAGVRYQHPSGTAVQAAWERTRTPAVLNSDLYDQPIALAANLVQEKQQVDARWHARYGLVLEGALARTRWLPFEATARAPSYQFAPSGTGAFDQAALRWRRPGAQALLRWTRFAVDLQGDVSWWGEGFGGLDYLHGSLHSWLAAVELTPALRHRTLLEFESARLDARARGEIESWPFTSTLVDLLGQRRIFRLSGSADWQRWHLSQQFPIRRRASGRASVEWIDILPQGQVESWRPAFLVFGKADAQTDPLSVRRVNLAVLSLGATLSVRAFELDLGLEQCVFARALNSSPPASVPPAQPTTSAPRHDEEGAGTRLRLVASRHF